MKRAKKRTVIERAALRNIVGLARIISKLVSSTSNILATFEELRKYFPKLRLKVVPDCDMPDYEARANPKQWIIKIREGIYQGLLRGDVRARWTLAHELAHVFLHSRRLPRSRPDKEVRGIFRYEREADAFASSLLMPYEQALACGSATEIAKEFGVSLDAAKIRLEELKLEAIRRRAAIANGLAPNAFAVETLHAVQLERRIAIVCTAILDTIAEASLRSSEPLQPISNNLVGAAIATVAASHLLLEAYESAGSLPNAYEYRTAATLSAAILAVQPVRSMDHLVSSSEILRHNQQCALRAGAALLGIRFDQVSGLTMGIPDYTDFHFIDSVYLRPLLVRTETLLKDENVTLTLSSFPSYEEYNGPNDICWSEVREIEHLMELFMLLANTGSKRLQQA
jgi:hypothetical protein